MFKANSSRIDWFLKLQRLLDFPRHFLAPSRGRDTRRPPAGMALDDEKWSDQSVRTDSVPMAGLLQSRILLLSPLLRRPSADRPAFSGTAPSLARTFPPHCAVWPLRPQVAGMPAIKLPRGSAVPLSYLPRAAKRPEPLAVQQLSKGGSIQTGLHRGPTQAVSLAPIDAGSRSQTYEPSEPFCSRATQETRPAEALAARRPVSVPEIMNSAAWFEDEQLPETDSSQRGLDGQPSDSKPNVSILHIDGSVLGRWALQHLEKSLGKPAAGMTGVDPRAAVPRTRVAPY